MAEVNDPFQNDYEYASYEDIKKYSALNNMHVLLMVKELKKLLANSVYGNLAFPPPEYHMEQHCAEYDMQETNSNKIYEEYYRLMMTTQKKVYNETS